MVVALFRHPVSMKLLLCNLNAIWYASCCCCCGGISGVFGISGVSSLFILGVDELIGSGVSCTRWNLLVFTIDGDKKVKSGVFSFVLLVGCVSGMIYVSGMIEGSFSGGFLEGVSFSTICGFCRFCCSSLVLCSSG